jgi:hypothetical protein
MLKRNLVDEVARLSAMPIPRRRVFKYLGGGLAGAALAFLGVKRADAIVAAPHCVFGMGECCSYGNTGPCDPSDGMCAAGTPGWRRVPDHYCPSTTTT